MPNLEEVVVQDGVAHFNNQEAAERMSAITFMILSTTSEHINF